MSRPRSLSEKLRIVLAGWRRIGFCLRMSKRYRPWKIDEPMLLPATVQEFVGKDHLARFVLNLVVEEIDLEAIERVYHVDRGQPPFDPAMMTALLLYGYCNGVYSSRRIAKACRERVDFMSIVGLDAPDFRTISDFRKRHLQALGELFKQVLHLCEKAGLATAVLALAGPVGSRVEVRRWHRAGRGKRNELVADDRVPTRQARVREEAIG